MVIKIGRSGAYMANQLLKLAIKPSARVKHLLEGLMYIVPAENRVFGGDF
jgi:hypothetical protein